MENKLEHRYMKINYNNYNTRSLLCVLYYKDL